MLENMLAQLARTTSRSHLVNQFDIKNMIRLNKKLALFVFLIIIYYALKRSRERTTLFNKQVFSPTGGLQMPNHSWTYFIHFKTTLPYRPMYSASDLSKDSNPSKWTLGKYTGKLNQQMHIGQDNEKIRNKSASAFTSLNHTKQADVIAVLVIVCDRPTVKRCLDQLFKYRPSANKFPIIVSQDCGSHPETTAVLKSYGNLITHINQPNLTNVTLPPADSKMQGYYKLSRHYGWALEYAFEVLNNTNLLIVEDDLDVAPDFFEYFEATLEIMKKDSSIWCISAWNHNGKGSRINQTAYDLLYRTDFFTGLGWMTRRSVWKELRFKWPKAYWDDWMQQPAQRKNRVCIRPEISRTRTFGKEGVSNGQYYNTHLKFIQLNEHYVPFKSRDLSYLLKENYDKQFKRKVNESILMASAAQLINVTNKTNSPLTNEYRLEYKNETEFKDFAKTLDLMEDFSSGVPRTGYEGVVSFVLNGYRCYLAAAVNNTLSANITKVTNDSVGFGISAPVHISSGD